MPEEGIMRNIYAQVREILEYGGEAVLVTVCGSDGVGKQLYSGEAVRDWDGKRPEEESLYMEKSGGDTTIAERFLPRPRMIIFGGGHIALVLSRMASMLDFDVTVFDDRPSFANPARFPEANEVICDGWDALSNRVAIRGGDYVVIVTRGHKHDQECLRHVLSGETPYYTGMIGSRRRVAIVRRQMEEEGYAPELIARLHSPIGLAIGAVTPEEIAISILAEVISEKRKGQDGDAHRQGVDQYADTELMEFLARGGEDAALVTVLRTEGSTPREAGAKMAVLRDGRLVGTIGGGCAEADVTRDALGVIDGGGYRFKTIDMTDSAEEDGMVCGGRMEVLIEAVKRP
jgi:xanthine dehydrogenase accessory factor